MIFLHGAKSWTDATKRVKEREEERRGEERGGEERRREGKSLSNCFSFHCLGGVEQRVNRNVRPAGFERPWWARGERRLRWTRAGYGDTEWDGGILRPFNSAQFSAAVYLPVACIFIAIPKTNSVGAWPLISDANESCGVESNGDPIRRILRRNRWINNRRKDEDWSSRFLREVVEKGEGRR